MCRGWYPYRIYLLNAVCGGAKESIAFIDDDD